MKNINKTSDIVVNRKASYDYIISEKIECGIVLVGTEVKSIRAGRISLDGSYAVILSNELWLLNSNIHTYEFGHQLNHNPIRNRKLLVHRKEINDLKKKTEADGYTLIPLKLYIKNNMIKLQLGVCKGKNKSDKRNTIKNRNIEREIHRYNY